MNDGLPSVSSGAAPAGVSAGRARGADSAEERDA